MRLEPSPIFFKVFAMLLFCIGIATLAPAYDAGPFDLQLTASLTESYDDNITSAAANTRDDYITTATVGLTALYEEKLKQLSFTGRISHQIHDQYSGYDNTSEDLSLSYFQEFSPYERLNAGAQFTHAEEPASFDDEFGGVSGRYSYNRGRVNLAFAKDVTQEFSWIARYAAEVTDYSRADLTDSVLHRLGATGQYVLGPKTILSGIYDLYWREFDPGPDATINSLGAGLRQFLAAQTYADLSAGYDFIDSYNGKSYIKPFASARLTWEMDKTRVAYAAISKQYTTNASTQDIFNQWQASAGYNHQLLRRLAGTASLFYGQGKYNLFNIKDTFEGASLGLAYDLIEDVQLTAGYTYSQTDSNLDSRDYERNVYSAGVRAQF